MDDDTDLIQLMEKVIGHIQKQDRVLESLRRNQTNTNEQFIDNSNALHKLDDWLVELK